MAKANFGNKDNKVAILEKRKIPSQELVFQIVYKIKTYKPFIFTSDGSLVIILAAYSRSKPKIANEIKVYSLETGERVVSSIPKYRRIKEFQKV